MTQLKVRIGALLVAGGALAAMAFTPLDSPDAAQTVPPGPNPLSQIFTDELVIKGTPVEPDPTLDKLLGLDGAGK